MAAAWARAGWQYASISRTRLRGSAWETIQEKYGNLFQMYRKITDEDAYKVPMRIYPAIHYTMGGLWADYNLMSNPPGLHRPRRGEFLDHGANRLGASALMQGLADGYFIIPYTIGHYIASTALPKVTTEHDAFNEVADSVQKRINQLLSVAGQSAASAKRIARLGRIMWDDVGMARTEGALGKALEAILALRDEFWYCSVSVPGGPDNLNQSLEHAGRVGPTTSSSPSSPGRLMRSSAVSPAAATSAKKARRLKVKRSVTTTTIPMSPPGSSPASAASRSSTKNRLRSTKYIQASGVTSEIAT